MFNAHKILQSTGKGLDDREFFDPNVQSEAKRYHQNIRLGALLHDLGTFCFSHTTEQAYIAFGRDKPANKEKKRKDDHEHLGSFIIKNTYYKGGISEVLARFDIDPQEISDLVKGISTNILANQILHSEVDCDRMDYLLRDAHYTGLNYGTYDRDYLLHHFVVDKVDGKEILAINHNALHSVEDFLSARFAWYSQVVRSPRGAKYDSLAEDMTYFLLEKKEIHSYDTLLEMTKGDPIAFYAFNDQYFMGTLHRLYGAGFFKKYPRERSICESLLFAKSPKTIRLPEFAQHLLDESEVSENGKIFKRAKEKLDEINAFLRKNGTKEDWVVEDIPERKILFTQSKKSLVKEKSQSNLLLERDPTKIKTESGQVQLLVDVENSLISKLQNHFNFIPNVYCSHSFYDRLKESGMAN